MFAKFASKVQGAPGRSESKYELNEILAILDMANAEMSKEDIAKITGRTKDSLNYKIFEGQTTIKGKTNVRSVKRYWYENPTVKGSPQVTTEVALTKLFTAHGQEFKGEADVEARIAAYQASREAVNEAV